MGEAVIVTGAAGGIGQALVEAFSSAGVRVIGLSLEGRPDTAPVSLAVDLAELGQTGALARATLQAIDQALSGHRLRALINNAAVQHLGATGEIDWSRWQDTLAVNLSAPMALIQALLPRLRADHSSVLNIGSVHARATKPGFAAYATSKAALHGLGRALAVDLGPEVRVLTLAPAAIETDMLRAGFVGNPEGLEALARAHPSGRIGRTDEVARAALWLTGPDCGFMTGAEVFLDGGVLSRLHDPA